jgi:hypothetical protein
MCGLAQCGVRRAVLENPAFRVHVSCDNLDTSMRTAGLSKIGELAAPKPKPKAVPSGEVGET